MRCRIGLGFGPLDEEETWNNAWHRDPDPDGWTRFAWVPLGIEYVAMAYVDSSELQQVFAGPRSAGQQVSGVLEVPEQDVVVVGRFLDDAGRPVPTESLDVHYSSAHSSGSCSVLTDEQGRFEWLLGPPRDDEAYLEAEFTMKRTDATPLLLAVRRRDLKSSINDLGDLVLTEGPLLVAGRFLGDVGRRRPEIGFVVEELAESGGWVGVDRLASYQRSDGRFEVRGASSAGRHRLRFQASTTRRWRRSSSCPVRRISRSGSIPGRAWRRACCFRTM